MRWSRAAGSERRRRCFSATPARDMLPDKGEKMQAAPSNITKTYPPRGPLQQHRFVESTAFDCFRCGQAKKSKLITVYRQDWSRRLCNGCYGRLLSIFEIKAGTAADYERADAMAATLGDLVADDDVRQAEKLFRASEERAERLSPEALRFIATAEYVAGRLGADPQLEWSPAVIGLCKAVEAELVLRVIKPLAGLTARENLSADRQDKELGRIAAFCADPSRKPPELGAFAHFLQTAIHSKERRESSVLVRAFLKLLVPWPGSHWLLQPDGLYAALSLLTAKFRNPAAHTDELGQNDYLACRQHVIGEAGMLWKLLIATESRR